MGKVLAFSPRPPATDWSANERGLLTLLTQQLTASYGEVDGVFGQTDAGDPWYVVTDANQDVLVHIARIDGQFVVHDAAIDMFHQVGSLWGALRQVMAPGAQPDPSGVVVAFNPASREAQSFLSLVIAVGLYLELQGLEFGGAGRVNFEALPRSDVGALDLVAAKLIAALNREADRTEAHGAVLTEVQRGDAPAAIIGPVHDKLLPIEPPPSPALSLTGLKVSSASSPLAEGGSSGGAKAPPAAEPPVEGPPPPEPSTEGFTTARWSVAGTAGADTLNGTAGADVIKGEAGDDYIDGRGAGAGQVDRLDGGAGDDTIVMNARVVASGGTGADTFLISGSPTAEKAGALLGVVLDFSAGQGDHLEVLGKAQLTVVSTTAVADVLALQGAALGETGAPTLSDVNQPVAGARVGFDVDGDGHEDVYVLLGGATSEDFHLGMTLGGDLAAAPIETVPLVGQPTPTIGHPGDPAPHA